MLELSVVSFPFLRLSVDEGPTASPHLEGLLRGKSVPPFQGSPPPEGVAAVMATGRAEL